MALLYHLLFFILLLFCNCTAERWGEFCNKNSNIGSNSPISANIDRFLAEVVSKVSLNGYVATSYGEVQNRIYGLAQCRGDVSKKDCLSCIEDAAKQIRELCKDQADARVWFDYCFLRYNKVDFIGELDTSFGIYYWNVENVTEPKVFEKELGALIDHVKEQALTLMNEGLGRGQTKLSPFLTIYALVQCTRDLSQLSCAQCLATAVGNFPNFCLYKKGCRVLYSSCIVREKSRVTLSIKQLEEDPLLETLDKVIPQDDESGSDTLSTTGRSNIEPLPGLETICNELLQEDGISDIRISRQGFEKRVVSQDLHIWISNAPATDNHFTLLARAGRQVQEIHLTTSLDQEGIKKALRRVLERVP